MIGELIGSIIGRENAGGDLRAQRDAMSEALGEMRKVETPDIEKMKLQLQEYKNQGFITPEQEKEILAQLPKLAQIQEDPATRKAQADALVALKQIGQSGLRSEDRAALADIQNRVQQDLEAKRQQIIQNMQARGQAGGGAEIAAALSASQAGAQNAAEQGRQVAAQASQRALQAIMQQGGLAGQMRSQDFDIAAQKAKAEDYVNQFNTQNAIARQQRNLERENAANLYNLQKQQQYVDKNVDLRNFQQQYNKQLLQQDFENKMKKAGAMYGALTNQAKFAGQTARDKMSLASGIGEGIQETGMEIGSYFAGAPKAPNPSQTDYDRANAYNTYMSGR